MTTQTKLLWIAGVIAGAAIALYFGVSLGTLLIVGALLLCPAAMYFGMRGMGERGGQRPSGNDQRSNEDHSKSQSEGQRSQTQTKQ